MCKDKSCCGAQGKGQEEKAIVSVTGKNHSGIVAKLSAVIAEDSGNFLDIQQTIVNEYFTMVIVVDISGLNCDFSVFKEHLLTAAKGNKSRHKGCS